MRAALAYFLWPWRLRRCEHRMVQMIDGPVCRVCGRSWIWNR